MRPTPVSLPHDSTPRHPHGAVRHARVPLGAQMTVTVVLGDTGQEHARSHGQGTNDAALRDVARFAVDHGLRVTHASKRRNDVTLAGTARQLSRAFDVELHHFEHRHGAYVSHTDAVRVPAMIAPRVRAVLGLDLAPMCRRAPPPPPPSSPRAPMVVHTVRDVARAYEFPHGTGRGQRIALLQFGGGFHRSDIRAYFAKLGVRTPNIRVYSVLGARNAPVSLSRLRHAAPTSNPDPQLLATIEATLDLQVAGGVAPGASFAVYFAPNHAHGYYESVLAAIGAPAHATPRATRHRPADIVSISWGASEAEWTPHALEAMNAALKRAHDLGVTVCTASGDFGSRGTTQPTRVARVDFPASSPYVLACGGTTLDLSTTRRRPPERAWNSVGMATGGGVSGYFARPPWQHGLAAADARAGRDGVWVSEHRSAPFRGRCVPDVSANADPQTGYEIIVGGRVMPGGGTSAAAPLWAGLLAVVAERLSAPLGVVMPRLYERAGRAAFRGITHGDNRVPGSRIRSFRAHRGWNACTGLGRPIGERLLALLQTVRT